MALVFPEMRWMWGSIWYSTLNRAHLQVLVSHEREIGGGESVQVIMAEISGSAASIPEYADSLPVLG